MKGYVFRNKISCENLLKFTLYPNGSGLLAMHPMNGNYSGETYYTQFKDDVILKERRRQYSNERFSGINESIRIKDGADLAVQTVSDSVITNGKKIIKMINNRPIRKFDYKYANEVYLLKSNVALIA